MGACGKQYRTYEMVEQGYTCLGEKIKIRGNVGAITCNLTVLELWTARTGLLGIETS